MAQKKGKTGNPNGRPKGKPNKTTAELKEAINQIVSNNIDKIQADINCLESKERLMFIEKLFKYVIPPAVAETAEQIDYNQRSKTFLSDIYESYRNGRHLNE